MSFRLRLTVLAALAVAVAIVGTSFVVYYTDRHELIREVDGDLSSTVDQPPLSLLLHGGLAVNRSFSAGSPAPLGAARRVGPAGFKVVLPRLSTAVQVNVTPHEQSPAAAKAPPRFSSRTVKGVPTRVLTLARTGDTVTIERSLVDVNRNLAHLRWLLVFISLGGVGAAAILGALVSRRAVAPLRRLTETTERIVATGDLGERIGQRGRDEISRLSARLDELLSSLETSVKAQRQLVADASHELRTPLATLRANVELLASPGLLAASERSELLADAQEELESMTTLIGELVELARGEEQDATSRPFRLDEVVRSVVERAQGRAPELCYRARLEPTVVSGVPERVERAVANLLDNARKWSPANEAVDVAVYDGLVEVRDRGPGIDAEDAPLVFNRFYRSAKARGTPGAGLGLAIVKQIADAHGGTVTVDRARDGGAIVRLRLSATR